MLRSFAAIIDDFNHIFHIVLSNVKIQPVYIIYVSPQLSWKYNISFFESTTENNHIVTFFSGCLIFLYASMSWELTLTLAMCHQFFYTIFILLIQFVLHFCLLIFLETQLCNNVCRGFFLILSRSYNF